MIKIPEDIMQIAKEAHADFARSDVTDNLTIIIAKAIMAGRDGAEEALKTVLASLVATTSLIIRAEDMKVRPSKAVASDAMFLQMLKDYDKATVVGRAALTGGVINHG